METDWIMAAKILIVDDERGLTDVLRELLDFEGFHTVVCHDEVSARDALVTHSFDVVMLDVFLSDKPVGLDLAGDIHLEHPDTGVVLMTGYADKGDVGAACLKGAYTCIDKPFTLDHVLRAINTVLGTRDPGLKSVSGGVA
jgi:DNA-binding NtrC family response regulator